MRNLFSMAAGLMAIAVVAGGITLADDHKKMTVDGTAWSVEVHPDSNAKDKGEKEFHETLIFADGMLSTTKSKTMGFEAVPYKATRSGDGQWDFSAQQMSADQGTFVWSGTIKGDDASGKLVWTKPDNSVFTYTFNGDMKK